MGKSELKNLKKEIWGKDSFDTTELRKNNRAYDSRWLIAQLKITRALELEDNLKKKKKMEESEDADKKKKKKREDEDEDEDKKKKEEERRRRQEKKEEERR